MLVAVHGVGVGDLSEQCDFSVLTFVASCRWFASAPSVLEHAVCIHMISFSALYMTLYGLWYSVLSIGSLYTV